ncbi:hypothetical protein ACRRTK_010321 [Alexandromys fortis]
MRNQLTEKSTALKIHNKKQQTDVWRGIFREPLGLRTLPEKQCPWDSPRMFIHMISGARNPVNISGASSLHITRGSDSIYTAKSILNKSSRTLLLELGSMLCAFKRSTRVLIGHTKTGDPRAFSPLCDLSDTQDSAVDEEDELSFGDLVKDTCEKRKGGCTMKAFQSRLPHTVALVLTGTAFELQAEKEHSPPHGAKDLGEGVQDTCRKLKTMLLCFYGSIAGLFSKGAQAPVSLEPMAAFKPSCLCVCRPFSLCLVTVPEPAGERLCCEHPEMKVTNGAWEPLTSKVLASAKNRLINALMLLETDVANYVLLEEPDCTTVEKSITRTKRAEKIGKLQNQENGGQHAEDQHLALELMFRRLKLDPALLTQQWECIVRHLTQKIEGRVPHPPAEIYPVPHAEATGPKSHLPLVSEHSRDT